MYIRLYMKPGVFLLCIVGNTVHSAATALVRPPPHPNPEKERIVEMKEGRKGGRIER